MINIKKIGLIGFGVVGEGVYHVICQTKGLQMLVKRIAIRNPEKERNAPRELFTTDVNELINDPEIDTIVELIDDAEAAYKIVKQALINKKNVVTANKKMLASHLPELIGLQKAHDVSLLYEAAVAGSIPILRNLEEYYNNDLLRSIQGIVNGSTNYILTQMSENNSSYSDALQQAQDCGFAESNPALDVEGFDAQNKLVLLVKHTFGLTLTPSQIFAKGITQISERDIRYAKEKGLQIKLVAQAYLNTANEIVAYVMPQFVNKEHQLAGVKNEFNGILIGSSLADEQFLYGKGAGRYPTSSAVLSDLSALNYNYRYEYKRSLTPHKFKLAENELLQVYLSCNKSTPIDESLFEEILERYISKQHKHYTGIVNLKRLKVAKEFRQEGVSIIELKKSVFLNHRPGSIVAFPKTWGEKISVAVKNWS